MTGLSNADKWGLLFSSSGANILGMDTITHTDSGLAKAIKAAGNASKLARELGITRSAIYQWHEIPLARVPDVERVTGVSRHKLRPDFFGPAPKSGRKRASRSRK